MNNGVYNYTQTHRFEKYHSLVGKQLVVRHDVNSPKIPNFGSINHVILNGEVNTSLGEGTSFEKLRGVVGQISELIKGVVCIDYEGGRICRWGGDMPSVPSAYALSKTPLLLSYAGALMGKQLRALGIDLLLGPVVDIGGAETAFPSRCYGDLPDEVIDKAEQLIERLQKYVTICLKHYPNHGAVQGDSHDGLPESPFDIETFETTFLKPFLRLAKNADAIMTAHILVRQWDANNPATFSEAILQRLRDGGFKGIIITDSLTMGAVSERYGSPIEIALAAIKAGSDMLITGKWTVEEVLTLQNQLAVQATVDRDLRRLIKASAMRVDKLIAKRRLWPENFDLDYLRKETYDLSVYAADNVILYKSKFVLEPLNHSLQTAVLAPMLLSEKVKFAYRKVFDHDPSLFLWRGVSPNQDEIETLISSLAIVKDLVVFTYNSDVSLMQQELIHRLKEAYPNLSIRVCEANFAHKKMDWVPDGVDALCTYSADTTFLEVGLKRFVNNSFYRYRIFD